MCLKQRWLTTDICAAYAHAWRAVVEYVPTYCAHDLHAASLYGIVSCRVKDAGCVPLEKLAMRAAGAAQGGDISADLDRVINALVVLQDVSTRVDIPPHH
jgi:hypothetical protein